MLKILLKAFLQPGLVDIQLHADSTSLWKKGLLHCCDGLPPPVTTTSLLVSGLHLSLPLHLSLCCMI